MSRVVALLLLTAATPALGGCVAAMAASAVSMAARSAQGRPVSNEHLQPEAREACGAQAAQYGAVHITVVQQAKANKIIVWGSVDDGKQRHSFQCDFGTTITGFTLRPIAPAR